MEQFTLNTKIQRIADIADAPIDDELVLMSVEHGKYYSMNSVGSDIWQFISTPITISELFDKMKDLYAVEDVNYEEQILEFLTMLHDKKLITVLNT